MHRSEVHVEEIEEVAHRHRIQAIEERLRKHLGDPRKVCHHETQRKVDILGVSWVNN